MKYLILLVFVYSCAPSSLLISKDDYKLIPKGSRKVVVDSQLSPDSLLSFCAKALAKDGWPVQSDKTAMQIISLGRSIGRGTFVRPNVFIESTAAGSRAYFSGEWLLDANGQISMQVWTNTSNYGSTRIVFTKNPTTKTDYAYQKLVLLARRIPDGKITHQQN